MRTRARGTPSWPGQGPETGYVGADRSDHLAQAACRRGGPYVFKSLQRLRVLGIVTGAGADVAEPEPVKDLAHGSLVIDHAEALGGKTLQVHPPPAHDAVHGPVRAGLDKARQFRLLVGAEARRLAFGPIVLEPVRAAFVEAVDPVAQALAI